MSSSPTSTYHYMEHPNGEFFEIREAQNVLGIRRGQIGQACIELQASYTTPGRALENLQRLYADWQGKGFVSCAPSLPIQPGSVARELFTDEIDEHPEYCRFFDLGWTKEYRTDGRRLFHFAHGLHYPADFDLEMLADMGLAVGVIIEGDVCIDGVFSQLSYTYPGAILILGNVYAHSLAHRDSHMRIRGNVQVQHFIYGEYNDGSLEIDGVADGRAWVSDDHCMSATQVRMPRFGRFYEDDADLSLLSPKLQNLQGQIDMQAVREFMFAGKDPLRRGAIFIPPEVVVPEKPVVALSGNAQVQSYDEADAAIQELVGKMGRKTGAKAALDLLQSWAEQGQTPDAACFARHSHFLLFHVLGHNREFDNRYLPVLEALLALGLQPGLQSDSGLDYWGEPLLYEQPAAVAVIRRCLGAAPVWQAPPVGQQVQTPTQAHPRVRAVLAVAAAGCDAQEYQAALKTWLEYDSELVKNHATLMLAQLIELHAAGEQDLAIALENLLYLGAQADAATAAYPGGALGLAQNLSQDALLEIFYRHFPQLMPAEIRHFDVVYLRQLLTLEQDQVDFSQPAMRAQWLDPVRHIRVICDALPRLPQCLAQMSGLQTLILIHTDSQPQSLPQGRWDCPELRELTLVGLGLRRLPDLDNLLALQNLNLHDNQLSKLPKLPATLLALNIGQNPWRTLDALQQQQALQELNIDGVSLPQIALGKLLNLQQLSWCHAELSVFPETILELRALRELHLIGNPLSSLPDLSSLSLLQELELGACPLRSLPPSLLRLPNLRRIRLDSELLDADALALLELLTQRGVKVEVLRAPALAPAVVKSAAADLPEVKRMSKTQQRAMQEQAIQLLHDAEQQQPSASSSAVHSFEQVIAVCEPVMRGQIEVAEKVGEALADVYLRALCGKLACLEDVQMQAALAQDILLWLNDEADLIYSAQTQVGKAEVIAHHAIARLGMLDSSDAIALEKALEHIQQAIQVLYEDEEDEEAYLSLLRDKWLILHQLGRSDDAHALLYHCQRAFPQDMEFARHAQEAAFLEWDAAN